MCGCRLVRVFTAVSVCLSAFRTISQKPMQLARITKRDIEIFYDESWKTIYFGVKKSKVKVTRHDKYAAVFRQNAILPLAVYVSHTGFSLLQYSAAQAMLAAPGFPCVTSPLPLLLPRDINQSRRTDRFFPCVEFFAVTRQTDRRG